MANYVAQIFDVRLIVRSVGMAVLLTLLLVIGNVMVYSVRERVGEFALLKALGFSNLNVMGLVVAEAAVLCAVGGAVGLWVAAAAQERVLRYFWHRFGVPMGAVGDTVWLEGVALIVLLVSAVSVVPAGRVLRLRTLGGQISR
jgi:putative ABC transport system permease protein